MKASHSIAQRFTKYIVTVLGQKRTRTEHPSRLALIRQVIMGTGTGA